MKHARKLLILLIVGLASAGDSTNSRTHYWSGVAPNDDDNYYWDLQELYGDILGPMRFRTLVDGMNDFEAVLSNKIHLYETFPERMTRFKRHILRPECAVSSSPYDGVNDFESVTKPPMWLLNAFEFLSSFGGETNLPSQSHIPDKWTTPYPPQMCFDEKKYEVFENFTREFVLEDGGRPLVKTNNTIFKVVDVPNDLLGKFDGCGCSFSRTYLGCYCCFLWVEKQITFCFVIGYEVIALNFQLEVTANDQILIQYNHQVETSSFTHHLALFSMSLCLPHEWEWAYTVCVNLGIDFAPSTDKNVPSKLYVCPTLIHKVFSFLNFVILAMPCWVLNFKLPWVRRIGYDPHARLRSEYPEDEIAVNPIKAFFAVDQFDKVAAAIEKMEKIGEDAYNAAAKAAAEQEPKGKVMQNIGELPRVLKRGAPTKPINWELTEKDKLHYMAVLYTIPVPSPVTLDENNVFVKNIPGYKWAIETSLSTRKRDPSFLNLKVGATMGRSCGGIIVSHDKILTLCACIQYFYLLHKYSKEEANIVADDLFTLASPHIYVTYGDRNFQADQVQYELDPNPEKFMKKSTCLDVIEQIRQKKIQTTQDTYGLMVVMPVKRKFVRIHTLPLVPWNKLLSAHPENVQVEMTVIGMKKTQTMDMFDASGLELDPVYEMVKTYYNSCPKTSFCRKGIKWTENPEFDKNTQCFCARNKDFQLCDGTVGFPITTSQGVIGLNSLPMHCKEEGSMVAAVLSTAAIKEFDDYIHPATVSPRTPATLVPTSPIGRCSTLVASSPMIMASFSVLLAK